MGIFDSIDLEGLQRVLFPVIEAVGGPDIEDIISGKAEALHLAAAGVSAIAGILDMAGDAADDGILSGEEINAIVAAAGDLDEAYDAVRNALINAQPGA